MRYTVGYKAVERYAVERYASHPAPLYPTHYTRTHGR